MICQRCNIEFEKTSNNQKYCSECGAIILKCRIKKYDETHKEEASKRKKEFYQTHKEEPKRKKYSKKYSKKYYKTHKEQHHQRMKKWREEHKKEVKEYQKKSRMQVLIHYSGNPPKCACCGEDHLEFLSIDHINNDGAEHRKTVDSGTQICRWLIKYNYPSGFQILCHNCNMSKGFYGICPHETARQLLQNNDKA